MDIAQDRRNLGGYHVRRLFAHQPIRGELASGDAQNAVCIEEDVILAAGSRWGSGRSQQGA